MRLYYCFLLILIFSTSKAQTFDYYYNIADSLMISEKFDSAIHYYDSALKQDPSNLNSQFNRGLCYLYLEKYKSAITDFESYIKANKKGALIAKNPYQKSELKTI